MEDGVCNELEFHSPALPALCALGGPVIHVGSFTKSLPPGLRLGYLMASPEQVQRFTRVRQATDVNSPMVLQLALAHLMATGHLERHLPLLRQELCARQKRMLAASLPAGTSWTAPSGGMHLWVRLPQHVNVVDLYRRAQASNIAFAPGDHFFPGPAPAPFMRLSSVNVSPQEIAEGVTRVGRVLQEGYPQG